MKSKINGTTKRNFKHIILLSTAQWRSSDLYGTFGEYWTLLLSDPIALMLLIKKVIGMKFTSTPLMVRKAWRKYDFCDQYIFVKESFNRQCASKFWFRCPVVKSEKKQVRHAFSEISINCSKSAFRPKVKRNVLYCTYQNTNIKEGAHDWANKLAANVQHSQLMIESDDNKMQKVQSERRKQFSRPGNPIMIRICRNQSLKIWFSELRSAEDTS